MLLLLSLSGIWGIMVTVSRLPDTTRNVYQCVIASVKCRLIGLHKLDGRSVSYTMSAHGPHCAFHVSRTRGPKAWDRGRGPHCVSVWTGRIQFALRPLHHLLKHSDNDYHIIDADNSLNRRSCGQVNLALLVFEYHYHTVSNPASAHTACVVCDSPAECTAGVIDVGALITHQHHLGAGPTH